MDRISHTPGPIFVEKCRCGHPACSQYVLSTQGGVGFSLGDATLYSNAPDMLEELRKAAAQFRYYEQQHRAKPPSDDTAIKAEANRIIAERIEALVAKATGAA